MHCACNDGGKACHSVDVMNNQCSSVTNLGTKFHMTAANINDTVSLSKRIANAQLPAVVEAETIFEFHAAYQK